MKKTFALSTLIAAFLFGGSILSANGADLGSASSVSKAADIAKQSVEARAALESSTPEKNVINPDDIAAKAKEKASGKIEQIQRDMQDKAKEQVNENIEDMKNKTGINQAKEASPLDKTQEMKTMPAGEKKSPASLIKEMKKQ